MFIHYVLKHSHAEPVDMLRPELLFDIVVKIAMVGRLTGIISICARFWSLLIVVKNGMVSRSVSGNGLHCTR